MLSHAQRAFIWLIDGTSVLNGWRNNTKTVDLAQASPWSEVLNFSVLVLVRACPVLVYGIVYGISTPYSIP